MAQIIDTSKTTTCEQCHGKGLDPETVADAPFNPDLVQLFDHEPEGARDGEVRRYDLDDGSSVAAVPVQPLNHTRPEGCAPCNGTGEVLADDAVVFESDDPQAIIDRSHELFSEDPDRPLVIVGLDSTELPDTEHPDTPTEE